MAKKSHFLVQIVALIILFLVLSLEVCDAIGPPEGYNRVGVQYKWAKDTAKYAVKQYYEICGKSFRVVGVIDGATKNRKLWLLISVENEHGLHRYAAKLRQDPSSTSTILYSKLLSFERVDEGTSSSASWPAISTSPPPPVHGASICMAGPSNNRLVTFMKHA